MKAFRLDELEAERAANDGAYLQFLRERNMSVGLYALDLSFHVEGFWTAVLGGLIISVVAWALHVVLPDED